jgi:hypothetical protein
LRSGASGGTLKSMKIRRNILFVNNVKYLCVIFDNRISWRMHIEMIDTKAFRIFIRVYFLFKVID